MQIMSKPLYCQTLAAFVFLAILDICIAYNIALGKNAKQSSVMLFHISLNASLAVDGYTADYVGGVFSCSHTLLEQTQPWWAVDLGAIYTVTNVVVYGRTDGCCPERMSNFDIDVIMPSACSFDKWATFQRGETIHCYHQIQSITFLNATCPFNTVGRFVRIQLRSVDYFTLCEVEVYGALHQMQPQVKTNNVRKACGYNGMGYNGNVIETTHASSNIQCTSICRIKQRCCAAEFIKSTNQCILLAKDDDKEETTHSMYSDSQRHLFML